MLYSIVRHTRIEEPHVGRQRSIYYGHLRIIYANKVAIDAYLVDIHVVYDLRLLRQNCSLSAGITSKFKKCPIA